MDNVNQKFDLDDEKYIDGLPSDHSQTDYNYLYFKQMLNVRSYRKEIQKKMEELNEKRQKIYQKVVYYEKKTDQQFRDYIRGEAPQRKKRNRRNADEINRQYNCPTCNKKYGSQGSLHQHVKLKHPNVYEPKKKDSKSQYSQQSPNHNDS